MKIEIENEMAVIKSDDGAALFHIGIAYSGEPAVIVRSASTGFRMHGVRYCGSLDIRPVASNSVKIISSRHPNNEGGSSLLNLK